MRWVYSRGEMGNERKEDKRRLKVLENGLHRHDGGGFVLGVLHKTSEMAHLTAPYSVALDGFIFILHDGGRWIEHMNLSEMSSSSRLR